MKKRIIQILSVGFSFLLIAVFFAMPAAAYNNTNAVNYARAHAKKYNTDAYKTIDQDCTNFISQCVNAGGVSMSVHTNHGLKAPNTKNYVMDSNQNYWYHIKEQQPGLLGIKRTVYVYSSTWSFVDQFRNYSIGEQGETAPPSIRKATFAAFSASAGGSQPSPCGLANLPLRVPERSFGVLGQCRGLWQGRRRCLPCRKARRITPAEASASPSKPLLPLFTDANDDGFPIFHPVRQAKPLPERRTACANLHAGRG